MTRSHVRHVTLLSAAHGLNHAYLIFFSPLLLSIRADLAIDHVALGGLVTFAFAAYGIGSLPAGWVSDRLGHRNTLAASTILAALGVLAAGMADSYTLLALGFVLIGAGGSLYHPAATAYLALAVKPERLGAAMGLHGIGANVLLIAAPVVTGLLAAQGAWRVPFIFWGVVGLAVGVTISLTVPEINRRHESGPAGDRLQSTKPARPGVTSLPHWGGLLTMGTGLLLMLTAFQGFAFGGANSYLAPYLQENLGQTVALSGWMMGLLYAGGIPGQYVGGRLTDRHGRLFPIAAGTIGSVTFLALLPFLTSQLAVAVCLFFVGVAVFMLQPPMTILLSDETHEDVKGLAFGTFFAVTNGAGALAPLWAGYLAQSDRLVQIFLWMAAVKLISLPLIPAYRRWSAFKRTQPQSVRA